MREGLWIWLLQQTSLPSVKSLLLVALFSGMHLKFITTLYGPLLFGRDDMRERSEVYNSEEAQISFYILATEGLKKSILDWIEGVSRNGSVFFRGMDPNCNRIRRLKRDQKRPTSTNPKHIQYWHEDQCRYPDEL
jgi:hypothetical protein